MAASLLDGWKIWASDPRTQGSARILAVSGAAWALLHLVFHILLRPWFMQLLDRNPSMVGKEAKKADTHLQMTPRVVCFIHNLIQVPLALMILTDAAFQNNPMYETTSFSSAVMAISGGYFLYDSIECLVRIRTEGAEFLMHGVFCGLVYANLLRSGVMHFFGAGFLLWELSTPFMHLRWFLFKIGMGDSKLYLANALTGMLVFFGCRNFWGIYLSVRFWQATSAALQTSQGQELLPPSMMLLFRVALFALNGLNAFWASKMLQILFGMLTTGKAGSTSKGKGATANGTAPNSTMPGAASLVDAAGKKAQ